MEAMTFSIFYNNALYLFLVLFASFYALRSFNPSAYPFMHRWHVIYELFGWWQYDNHVMNIILNITLGTIWYLLLWQVESWLFSLLAHHHLNCVIFVTAKACPLESEHYNKRVLLLFRLFVIVLRTGFLEMPSSHAQLQKVTQW